jgi:hypothetical protein
VSALRQHVGDGLAALVDLTLNVEEAQQMQRVGFAAWGRGIGCFGTLRKRSR